MHSRIRNWFSLGVALASLAIVTSAPAKRVALVFDDGPVSANAEPLLAVLAQENVHVTFSLVGDRVAENPAMAKTIAAAGHELANHSQTHAHPRELSDAALDREVADAQRRITAAAGVAPRWYWPPFIEIDDRVRAAVQRAGIVLYATSRLVVSKDYDRNVGAAEILRLATTNVSDGAVILFHEWREETRQQLPAILAELRKQGCEFLTFSQLHDALASAPVTAPAATSHTEIPSGGEPVHASLANYKSTAGSGNSDAIKFSTVDAAGPGFTQALHVETTRDLSPPWAIEVRAAFTKKVRKGDVALVRFFARAISSTDETGFGQVRVAVQRGGGDYHQSLDSTVQMRGEWQEFLLPFAFADDLAAGEGELTLGFGFKRQVVEVGGIEVLDFGNTIALSALPKTRFTYAGREADAAWRQEALARIEQVRKSNFVIEARDASGQPVGGYTVRVEQVRSAFQFGSALQFKRLLSDKPEDAKYRDVAKELFNAASPENDLKWYAWIGEDARTATHAQVFAALRWLRGSGFHVRGHVLVWPGWKNLPDAVRKLKGTKQQAQIPAMVTAHIADITAATREWVQEWDVLNEPFDNHDLMALFGNDVMLDWFKAAAASAAPGAPLYLNDYSNHDLLADRPHCMEFFRVAKFLQSKGAPLGGFGLQGHISAQPNPPINVLATLQVYSELKLPIRITEFDVDTDDEQLQADYTRDFLILAYSHPSVVGVQHWGFWQSAHWRPKSAMFRADWSEKPSAKIYRDLVLNQWRTRLQGTAGAKGKVAGRGFHGDYVVTVEKDGRRAERTFTLRPEEAKTTVVVTLP
jgi:GH35 family endo-1,4-beta-xylanase/peptidoglycan/xylan/chitin deacetylase (PgdA/CDA1 family)